MCRFEFKMPLLVLPAKKQKILACIKRKYWFTNSELRFIPKRGWQLWYKMSRDIQHKFWLLCLSVELGAAQHSEWTFLGSPFSLCDYAWKEIALRALILWQQWVRNCPCSKTLNSRASKTDDTSTFLFVQSTEGHLTASRLQSQTSI